jgi:hypothetical protein|tara:strand:+ start:352 stop:507 length:156 start_codon:yes stop_codon:yes gene_type:complete
MIAKAKCEKCKQMIRFDEVLTHKCGDHVPDHLRNIPADRLKTLKAIHSPKF